MTFCVKLVLDHTSTNQNNYVGVFVMFTQCNGLNEHTKIRDGVCTTMVEVSLVVSHTCD